jgi:signal transduction histidine kinase
VSTAGRSPFRDEHLDSRLEFELLLTELSSRFINLPPGEVDRQIEEGLRRVCEALDLDFAALWQWSTGPTPTIAPTHVYPSAQGAQPPDPGVQEEYPWTVAQMLAGRVIVLSSLQDAPPDASVDRESARRAGIKSNLTVPLVMGGEAPVGALAFNTLRVERDWPTALVNRLQLVAQVFATALARKRADEEMRDLSRRLIHAHEEERALLARELHDDVTQRLAVLAIDAGRAEGEAESAAQAQGLRALREELVRLSEDIHTLAYQLHPSVLEELGLAEALRAECERRGRRGGIAVSLDLCALPNALRHDAALSLFRVAQEALTNAIRHSEAQVVTVTLRTIEDGLLLAVGDDGVGFEAERPGRARHLGLASMRERMRLVDGTLDIESAQGQGTTVIAWAPLAGVPR